MIVGEAYVEIHAVTSAVRKEIKDGFAKGMKGSGTEAGQQFDRELGPEIDKTGEKAKTRLRTKMSEAGDQSGRSFMSRFKAQVSSGGSGIGNILKRGLTGEGGKAGDGFASKFINKVEGHFKNASVKTKLLAGLTSFIGPVLGTVGQLGGGFVALGSAIGQSAGTLPLMYGGLLSVVSAAGAAKLGLSGVGTALSTLNNQASTPAAISKAMGGLSPPAREFVKQLHSMQPALMRIKTTAGNNLLPGLEAGLKAVRPLIPPFRREIGQLDKSVGTMGKSLGRLLGGPMKHDVQTIFNNNSKVVHNLTGAVTPLVAGLLRLYKGMQPVIIEMSRAAKAEAEVFANTMKVNGANGTLTAYFQRAYDRARQLASILHNLANVVLNVGHAASSAGGTMLHSIDQVTAHWAHFTGTTKAQNSMATYFKNTIPVMKEVGGIIGDILKDLIHLGGSGDLMPLLVQIRTQLVPALDKVLQATTGPVAHDMVQFLSDLASGFATLAGSGSTGYLGSFIQTLDKFVQGLDRLINLPGVGPIVGELGSIAGAAAALGLILGKLRLLTFAKNLLGFGGAAKTAAKEVGGLEAAKITEKAAMEANNATVGKNITSYGTLGTKVETTTGKLGKLKALAGRMADPVGLGGAVAITAVANFPDAPEGRPISQSDKSAIADAKRLQVAGATADRAAQVIASVTPSATNALNAWAAAEDQVAKHAKRVTAAQEAMQHAVSRVKTGLSEMGAVATQVGSTSLKGNSNAAKANRQAMTDAADSVKRYRVELLHSGAPLDQVKQKTDAYAKQLRQNAIEVYGNKSAVDKMLHSLGVTASQLDAVSGKQNSAANSLRQYRNGLIAAGTPLSTVADAVRAYASTLSHVPRSIVSKITADTSLARAALQTLKTQITQLPDHTVRITTTTVGGSVSTRGATQRAGGGWIKGPGTSTSDSILARLSNNEFVVNAKQAIKNRHLLEAINSGAPGFAAGGSVSTAVTSGIQSRQQNLAGVLSGLVSAFMQAVQTSVGAVTRESNSLLRNLHSRVDSLEAYYKKHHLDGKLADLKHSSSQMFSAFKFENAGLEALARKRTSIVERLQKAQATLQSLRQDRANLISTIKSGISSYTDVTQIVPQGVAVTAYRIDTNLKYRLSMVKKWAANIKTLIRRGLNKTVLQDIINQGPEAGGPYAQALVDASKQQLNSINRSQDSIDSISKTVSKSTGDAFYKSGIAAAKGLVEGLRSQEKSLDHEARRLGKAIAEALRKELGIHSPSRVGREIGANIPHAVSLGIHHAIPLAENAAARMAARVSAAAGGAQPGRLGMLGLITSGGGGAHSAPPVHITIEHMSVRDERDIDKVAQALYAIQTNTNRAAGRATPPATIGGPA